MGKRLFVDMDGTLANFKVVDTVETLFEYGYFYNLLPQENVVNAVKKIIKEEPEIEVYILSAYLSDSKYALSEKNQWLDRYLPEIDLKHRLFLKCGDDKKEFIAQTRGEVGKNDFLLDDYSLNLHAWEPPAHGIKLMNGINGNFGTWKSDSLSLERKPDELASCIRNIVLFDMNYKDLGPNHEEECLEQAHSMKNGR